MGTIGTYGTKSVAPEVNCSVLGIPCWSGRHAREFLSSQDLVEELASFIRVDAKRRGNNDYVQDSVGNADCIFHPDFLEGWPRRLWFEHYQKGVDSAKRRALINNQ